MSADEKKAELEGRQAEADFLLSEFEQVREMVMERRGELENHPDFEKSEEAEKADEIAEIWIENLEERDDLPTDDELREIREHLSDAKMHANEAKPPFPYA